MKTWIVRVSYSAGEPLEMAGTVEAVWWYEAEMLARSMCPGYHSLQVVQAPAEAPAEAPVADPYGIPQHELGAKLDAGKTASGLLLDFSLALDAVAQIGTYGMQKYTRGGWQHVPDGIQRYVDAQWRHMLAKGEDEESGFPHEWHAAWCALAALELRLRAERAQKAGGA